jgi:hypothetical protein
MKPIHHPHLRHKSQNPSNKMKLSQPTVQSLQSLEAPILNLKPSGSIETITQTKWSHIPITFSAQDVYLTSFPHTDAMVIIAHIDQWDVAKIFVDNGSQVKVLFLLPLDKMGYNKKQLNEPTKPLSGFGGKRIEQVGVITLPVSFGTPKNPHTEYITFDVIDMLYPYNAIIRQGLLNTFQTALHSTYLCLKVPATFGAITECGSRKEAKNIEHGFAPQHKNVHFIREGTVEHGPRQPSSQQETLAKSKDTIEAGDECKRVH